MKEPNKKDIKDKVEIVIVDDHQLFRNGLKFVLGEISDFDIVAEASNGEELLALLDAITPDIIITDIKMPVMDGVEATRKALQRKPELKFLVLSLFGEEQYYNQFIDLGVNGFILKDSDNEELERAIRKIVQGETYFSQELLIQLIKNKSPHNNITLTRREYEVLQLICKGYATSEISETLHISQRTTERHRSNLLLKTDSNNSIRLVIYAIKNNLVSI